MNIFPRPNVPPAPAAPARALYGGARPAGGTALPGDGWKMPWPRVDATLAAIFGLLLTVFALPVEHVLPSELAKTAAYGVGITLLVSFAFEARSGIKNLVRADLMGILALYYLTLYEFLFKQPYFDRMMPHPEMVYKGIWAVFIGFIGLFIGRHLLPKGKQPFANIMSKPVPLGWLLIVFWGSFFLGALHMLLAVDFDVVAMVEAMMRARFEQPWGRGRLGDWKALLNELSLLFYLIPPVGGLMIARRERYPAIHIILVSLGVLCIMFYGFLSGTRSLFGTFLVTFMIAFTFASPPERRKQALVVCAICAALLMFSTKAMLQMRTIGFKRWYNGEIPKYENRQSAAVFVDDNLLAISTIIQYFPDRNGGRYLGFEIPYLALVRPVPRVIWNAVMPFEKPAGLSINVEDIFNIRGVTIAATFVGEGYMSGGFIAVASMGIILGWLAAWWNRLASPRNSELGMLVYASGFFAVTITMRSLFALTTAVLPSVAGLVIGRYVLPAVKRRFGKARPVLPPKLRNPPQAP